MPITVKPAFLDLVIAFNESAEPLGERSQEDLKLLLIIAYLSQRTDYVAMFVDPPTLNELLGDEEGGPGGAGTNGWSWVPALEEDGERLVIRVADWQGGTGSKPAAGGYIGNAGIVTLIAEAVGIPLAGAAAPLTAEALLALIDNEDDNATVIGTLIGDKIVLATNEKHDETGGLVTYEYLTENYVTNDAFQEALAAVYTAIAAGGGPAEMPLDLFEYYADFRSGVTLVGSGIDAVADQSPNGNNLIAASALLRPAYDATGWGGQPCAVFTGSQSLYISNLNLTGTQDATVFALLKRENGTIGVVVEHTEYGPNLPAVTGFGIYTNNGAVNVGGGLLGDQGTGQAGGTYNTGRLRAQFWKSDPAPEVKIFDNGTELLDQAALPSVDNTNFFSASPHFIGSRNNTSAFLVGKIAAIGLVPRKTTPVENAKIAAALLASYPTNP